MLLNIKGNETTPIENGNLEEDLRDQFLCGIHHDAVQQRLLSESKLTYVKAPEIAKGMESADKHS